MMANTLRLFVALSIILALCQFAIGGHTRQTISNRMQQSTSSVARDTYVSDTTFLLPDEYTLHEGQFECFDVLGNDNEQDIDRSSLQVSVQPAHGFATKEGDRICYQPDRSFSGWDSFEYSACDNTEDQTCELAEVRVYVTPINQAPTAVADYATVTDAPNPIVVDVLSNDYDLDGPFANFASLTIISPAEHGIATITPDHKISYQPIWSEEERFVGVDTFYYRICDTTTPSLCAYGQVGILVQETCVACENCHNFVPVFNDHLESIQKSFHSIYAVTL